MISTWGKVSNKRVIAASVSSRHCCTYSLFVRWVVAVPGMYIARPPCDFQSDGCSVELQTVFPDLTALVKGKYMLDVVPESGCLPFPDQAFQGSPHRASQTRIAGAQPSALIRRWRVPAWFVAVRHDGYSGPSLGKLQYATAIRNADRQPISVPALVKFIRDGNRTERL
jgi:hypothetical protein